MNKLFENKKNNMYVFITDKKPPFKRWFFYACLHDSLD